MREDLISSYPAQLKAPYKCAMQSPAQRQHPGTPGPTQSSQGLGDAPLALSHQAVFGSPTPRPLAPAPKQGRGRGDRHNRRIALASLTYLQSSLFLHLVQFTAALPFFTPLTSSYTCPHSTDHHEEPTKHPWLCFQQRLHTSDRQQDGCQLPPAALSPNGPDQPCLVPGSAQAWAAPGLHLGWAPAEPQPQLIPPELILMLRPLSSLLSDHR